jgi:hypothetical protein
VNSFEHTNITPQKQKQKTSLIVCNENANIYDLKPDWASIFIRKKLKLKVLEIQIISQKNHITSSIKTSKKVTILKPKKPFKKSRTREHWL